MDSLLLFSRSGLAFALTSVIVLPIHAFVLYVIFSENPENEAEKRQIRIARLVIIVTYIVAMPVMYYISSQILKYTIWRTLGAVLVSPLFVLLLLLIPALTIEALIDKFSSTCPACGAKGKLKRELRFKRNIEQLDEIRSIEYPAEDIWGQTCKKCGYFIPDK